MSRARRGLDNRSDKYPRDEGMEALTKELPTKEFTTMICCADNPCEELNRNMMAASADAFTHLGERWESIHVFM